MRARRPSRGPVVALVAEVVDASPGPGGTQAAATSWPPSRGPKHRRGPVAVGAEEIFEALAALLHAHQAQAQVGDRVADEVVGALVLELDEHAAGPPATLQALRRRRRFASRLVLSPSTSTASTCVRAVNVADRGRAQQLAAIDDDEVVADALDLAQQVGGHDDGDAELACRAAHQVQHLVAAGRVEAVRRLVEQHQPRVVDERLGELDALLHARGVAAISR